MNLREWINQASQKLGHKETIYLVKGILGLDDIELINAMESEIQPIAQIALENSLQERLENKPLSKITGIKHFMEYSFLTSEHTLDPRPETEAIIKEVAGTPRKILDLGAGTGCILLCLLKKFPKASGIGIDISQEALDIAQQNAFRLGVKKCEFIKNNWAYGLKGSFDLIVSNPPYLKNDYHSKELEFDPKQALYGGETGIECYIELLKSLENIEFKQLILEIPENLEESLKGHIKKIIKRENQLTLKKVDDTKISIAILMIS